MFWNILRTYFVVEYFNIIIKNICPVAYNNWSVVPPGLAFPIQCWPDKLSSVALDNNMYSNLFCIYAGYLTWAVVMSNAEVEHRSGGVCAGTGDIYRTFGLYYRLYYSDPTLCTTRWCAEMFKTNVCLIARNALHLWYVQVFIIGARYNKK